MNSSVWALGPMLENPSPHYTQEHTHTLPADLWPVPLDTSGEGEPCCLSLLPQTQKNSSQFHPAASVSMEAPLNKTDLYQTNLRARFKDSVVKPASSPQKQSPLWSWRDRPPDWPHEVKQTARPRMAPLHPPAPRAALASPSTPRGLGGVSTAPGGAAEQDSTPPAAGLDESGPAVSSWTHETKGVFRPAPTHARGFPAPSR